MWGKNHAYHKSTSGRCCQGERRLDQTDPRPFDLGAYTGTSVDDSYELPFRFPGKIDKLTFKLGPPQIAEADKSAID
jgi:hypothetical protein